MTTSVAVKPPCRVQTTAAITLSGEQTVNGVAVVTGDRVLVKDQADNTTNGIYIADTSAWSRAPDFDGSLDAVDGTLVLVHNASGPDQLWELSATNPVVIGTSALTFSLSSLTGTVFGASLVAAANAAAARTLLEATVVGSAVFTAVDAAAGRSALGAAALGANTFTADQTFAENAGVVLDAALSADGKYSGVVEAGTAGAALAFGEVCYLASTGKWLLARANAAATSSNQLGMCVLAAAADTSPTTMLLFGKIRADALFDTFTVGAPVYISAATAGKTVSAAPTGTVDFVVRQIGQAEDANTVFFRPDNITVTIDASSTLKTVGGVALPAGSSPGTHKVVVHTGNGHGSTNTRIRRFTTAMTNTGTDITYADSAANGASFTVNTTAFYAIQYTDNYQSSNSYIGISRNSAQLTTSIQSINVADRIAYATWANGGPGLYVPATTVLKLTAGDVIRAHTDGNPGDATNGCFFSIEKVGNA